MIYKFFVPAQQAKPGQPLAPILGQLQIKVQDFITEFNKQTTDYVEGLPLGCRIRKFTGSTRFILSVQPPTWFELLKGTTNSNRELSLEQLYDCCLFKFNLQSTQITPSKAKTILSLLKTTKLKIN